MPTFNHEDLRPCNVKQKGTCPKTLLYAQDELFHIFLGVGANDLNVAYEILFFMSLHCKEQQGKLKKCCYTHGEAAARVDLNDADGLECLTWAFSDGVFLPGDLLMLTGYHDWQRIIAGTMLHLISLGATGDEHCSTMHSHIM